MDEFQSKKIMVLDTEYESNPKRLLCLAYIIYFYDDEKWNKLKEVRYVKYPSDIFKVDENSDSFQYHKLTNSFLQENGESINLIIEDFSKVIPDIDIIIGQNVINADIQLIRKEAIGTGNWFGDIKNKLKNINIFDTMISFRDKNPELKSSLDQIYKYLFNKEIKNHHEAVSDCRNTFKCFEFMVNNDYKFENQLYKFSEDIFENLMIDLKKCSICESKIPNENNTFKYISKEKVLEIDNKQFSLVNDIVKLNDIICGKCLGSFELKITDLNNQLINIVKLKSCDSYLKDFFEVSGNELITIYLNSSYKEKDEIKKLGGKWDSRKKSWYFNYSSKNPSKISKFSKWIPDDKVI